MQWHPQDYASRVRSAMEAAILATPARDREDSKAAVCLRAGITRSTYYRWVRGKTKVSPQIAHVAAFAVACSVAPAWLAFGDR